MLWPQNSYSKHCIVYLNSPLCHLCSLPFPLHVTLLLCLQHPYIYPNSPLSDLVASSSYMDSLHGHQQLNQDITAYLSIFSQAELSMLPADVITKLVLGKGQCPLCLDEDHLMKAIASNPHLGDAILAVVGSRDYTSVRKICELAFKL